ncbi:DUF397 domain-containing protein [Streptomyces platensis]|uniref:DUF397 domain-containing protein n=1 Tax=Streptomyces platensis TaxID=58346 RepID=UPI0033303760
MTPLIHPWVKSSYSSQDGGDCVEWSPAHASAHGTVPVRDSKDPNGPALIFKSAAWSAFVADIQAADFPA